MNPDEQDQAAEPDWQGYYKWIEGREPRPLFVNALARFDVSSGGLQWQAIDLGCGDGTETLALLEAGWSVLAIDGEPAAIEHVLSKVSDKHRSRLRTMTASFNDLQLPETDFIYAGYSLPFCEPDCFKGLWKNIAASIRPGGRFAGQLFGIRDSWADNPEMNFHSAEQATALLGQAFNVEVLEETDEDGEAFSGPKHWHFFDIIARKRQQ
jgi:SAM-dependent methyltransferase